MKAFLASWAMFVFVAIPLAAQAPARLPRTADGKPDLNGIWQALNTAAWDLEDHSGALHTPPGQGVAEGGEIPYRPEAIKKKEENFAGREKYDLAETACYMPGVPRAMYMPYPFGIIQTPKMIEMNFTFAHARRNPFLLLRLRQTDRYKGKHYCSDNFHLDTTTGLAFPYFSSWR